MEGDRFLDVQVPVFPVVHPHELFVLVSNVLRFQVFVKGPVLLDQEIALAAINAKRGNAAVVDPLDDGERVFRTALGRPDQRSVRARAGCP